MCHPIKKQNTREPKGTRKREKEGQGAGERTLQL